MRHLIIMAVAILMALPIMSRTPERTLVTVRTNYGKFTLWLYDETPLHQANFLKMCENGTLKGMLFHRVIKDFIAQAGDLHKLPNGDVRPFVADDKDTLMVPAEILPNLFCKQGALIDAKQGDDTNPLRISAGMHFCVVQGRRMTNEELDRTEVRMNEWQRNYLFYLSRYNLQRENPNLSQVEIETQARAIAAKQYAEQGAVRIPEEHRAVYRKAGGTPHLDGTVTIFGELVSGQKVIERITLVDTDKNDRPLEDVEVLSVSVKRK